MTAKLRIYSDILRHVLITIRMRSSDAALCHDLADLAHNIPNNMLRERLDESDEYFITIEVPCYERACRRRGAEPLPRILSINVREGGLAVVTSRGLQSHETGTRTEPEPHGAGTPRKRDPTGANNDFPARRRPNADPPAQWQPAPNAASSRSSRPSMPALTAAPANPVWQVPGLILARFRRPPPGPQ